MSVLHEFLALPTVLFTVAAALSTLYWLFVMFTGVDLFDSADGAAEALGEAAGGALDGALDGLDGAADAAEGALGSVSGILHALRLGDVPLTLASSLVSILAWGACALGMRYIAPSLSGTLPSFVVGLVVALAAVIVAFPLAGLLARPLGPVFRTEKAGTNEGIVGMSAEVRSGTIGAGKSGQVEVQVGGATLLVDVQSDAGHALKRGDQVLLVSYDASNFRYAIEPLSRLIDESPSETPPGAVIHADAGGVGPM
ncbi:MAG: hypothetical protein ACI81R_002326 [Bradymonadia bacterium]|jgi:hypothetical protein